MLWWTQHSPTRYYLHLDTEIQQRRHWLYFYNSKGTWYSYCGKVWNTSWGWAVPSSCQARLASLLTYSNIKTIHVAWDWHLVLVHKYHMSSLFHLKIQAWTLLFKISLFAVTPILIILLFEEETLRLTSIYKKFEIVFNLEKICGHLPFAKIEIVFRKRKK